MARDLTSEYSVIILFLTLVAAKCSANDILGCGGFVKSHVSLDYSKIEIGLYTKEGSLKERTECAPTNGYYFLPLYEKGEYVLKVHPPAGWSFEPSQVDLLVDGATDQCSTGQDINFAFNGFGIAGRVITAGQSKGPKGVSVQLVDEKGAKRDTVTAEGGDFHFTPVIPGKYTVKASHPRWKLDPAQAVVQVKEGNTALPAGVLAVKGYEVTVSVTSFGSPISGVYVLLYPREESPKYRVEGCNTALLQGVPDAPICHSVTDGAGEARFGLVPAGSYFLRTLPSAPARPELRYNVRPEQVTFFVAHDGLYIKNAFEVNGFTVVGSVVTHAEGSGLSGARVLLSGRPAGASDSAGRFTLPGLQPGVYTLSFQHEQCEFDDVQLTVTAMGPSRAPLARAARWRVCGAVAPPARVSLTPDAAPKDVVTVSPDDSGKWCTHLPPGVYTARVLVSEQEQRDGLQFYPLTQQVAVGRAPVSGVSFSQLKATVSGRVRCLAPAACRALRVQMRALAPDGGYVGEPITAVVKNGEYSFSEVLPGSVEVSVPSDRLCWAESRHNVAVTQAQADVPAFQHEGYVLPIHASHDLEVEYSSKSSQGVLSAPAGLSRQCVPTAELYKLTPRGCHRVMPPEAAVDTAAEKIQPVHFEATLHAAVLRVTAPDPVDDLVLKINVDGLGTRAVGPLAPLDRPGGGYAYEHTLYMAEGEIAVVSAESSSLLFHPSAPQQVSGRAQCQPQALTIRAVRGLTLAGRVVPPVADVLVTLTSDDLTLTQTTTTDGTYRFGPLDASRQYAVAAEKESYVFGERDEKGDIAAHKLAEITVELLDDADGAPLQSALVSVSGGTYRRNVASGAAGALRFGSLSPGEYYVKPNMKEYRFQPPHQIVAVKEGRTHSLTLRGVRMAWSCVGRLVSLGGAGWAGATLAAAPVQGSNPRCATEEATTEPSGAFRIRGLLPGCTYALQLKESAAPELSGLKLARAPRKLEVVGNKDITDVVVIATQPHALTDASVLVTAPSVDHYRSLRLTLAPESAPHSPIFSTKLDATGLTQHLNPGLMYALPRLQADNKTYAVQLESTLPRAAPAPAHYFVSDGRYKHFTIHFAPKAKTSEQELRQSSLLVLPLLGALLLAYLQRDALLARVTELAGGLMRAPARAPRAPRPDVLDKASIDAIVSTVNATGKKGSKKKVQ